MGSTGDTELARAGRGSRDGAEQAAANEKQAESPALPSPLVLSHLSGSTCIFLSPDCQEIGGLCADEVWAADGWPGQHLGARLCAPKQRQPSSSWVQGLKRIWRDSCTADPGRGGIGLMECCLPRSRSIRSILGAPRWERQQPARWRWAQPRLSRGRSGALSCGAGGERRAEECDQQL